MLVLKETSFPPRKTKYHVKVRAHAYMKLHGCYSFKDVLGILEDKLHWFERLCSFCQYLSQECDIAFKETINTCKKHTLQRAARSSEFQPYFKCFLLEDGIPCRKRCVTTWNTSFKKSSISLKPVQHSLKKMRFYFKVESVWEYNALFERVPYSFKNVWHHFVQYPLYNEGRKISGKCATIVKLSLSLK